jgi:hypothetical protein
MILLAAPVFFASLRLCVRISFPQRRKDAKKAFKKSALEKKDESTFYRVAFIHSIQRERCARMAALES